MSRYRHEYKYLVDGARENVLLIRACGILEKDPHTDADGIYLIRSLYFDDYDDSCLSDNINGVDERSKFRIRYYNDDHSRLWLEKKSKLHGMTLKESCLITPEECMAFMSGSIPDIISEMPEIKKRLFLEMQFRSMTPKVIVSYERMPFIYPGGNVRVTFDRKITSSNDIGHFLSGIYPFRPVLPHNMSILEVKWDEILPLHIKDTMKLDTLQWTTFSKYYMCRTYHL